MVRGVSKLKEAREPLFRGEPWGGSRASCAMPASPGPPMTLGNIRSLGVRSLAATCELCQHEPYLNGELASVLAQAQKTRFVPIGRVRGLAAALLRRSTCPPRKR